MGEGVSRCCVVLGMGEGVWCVLGVRGGGYHMLKEWHAESCVPYQFDNA